ncbi:hypothetical protein GALMADRAFT_452511 [Galerina marginata CBS 339.88]|uniref:Uncharacterized protein n=1 Tax=Galerina marginata (strain CBS 339.88) TaxID=685588 RepID=A0A067T0G4_GALM3|nr:hypothetical protein GALMADRAFT_452511 [Galerina marginata CBS 339.88]
MVATRFKSAFYLIRQPTSRPSPPLHQQHRHSARHVLRQRRRYLRKECARLGEAISVPEGSRDTRTYSMNFDLVGTMLAVSGAYLRAGEWGRVRVGGRRRSRVWIFRVRVR